MFVWNSQLSKTPAESEEKDIQIKIFLLRAEGYLTLGCSFQNLIPWNRIAFFFIFYFGISVPRVSYVCIHWKRVFSICISMDCFQIVEHMLHIKWMLDGFLYRKRFLQPLAIKDLSEIDFFSNLLKKKLNKYPGEKL